MRAADPFFTPRDRPTRRCCEYAAGKRKTHTPRDRIHEGNREIPLEVVDAFIRENKGAAASAAAAPVAYAGAALPAQGARSGAIL